MSPKKSRRGHARRNELSPEKIRAIRKELGLTQVEAGELLGGGPRAFTKYESGATRPAASVVNLLRLLEANPGSISALRPTKTTPIAVSGTGPLELTGRHVAELSGRQLALLLQRLLTAEAQSNGLPAYGVHVAGSITTPDGGEDGRIVWTGGPERTAYLPARFCQFQLKSGPVRPAQAARDVLKSDGAVKELVGEALRQDGVYTMICSKQYVQKAVLSRVERILESLEGAGISVRQDQVSFRDGDQIAQWCKEYPAVATWVLEQTQPGLIGPFRSWTHWAGRAEHESSPLVADPRLPELRTWLLSQIAEPRSAVRIVGLSGVGKSRLALEALAPEGEVGVSPLVLYGVEPEVGSVEATRIVQNLADAGVRTILVVDRCLASTHTDLEAIAKRSDSRLSLVSIDDDVPHPVPPGTQLVDEAPPSVTEAMIKRLCPGLPPEDERRLAHFSTGYPRIAFLLCQAWNRGEPMAFATDEALVNRFVFGTVPCNEELASVAMLLSTFGAVDVEADLHESITQETAHPILALGRGLTRDGIKSALQELMQRGVAQRRGRSVVIRPHPIAWRLAERQWRTWGKQEWDQVLTETPPVLRARAGHQLARLNETPIAKAVARHVCRRGGPLDSTQAILRPQQMEVLSALAEIDPLVVVALLERALEGVDLSIVDGDVRRAVVGCLEKVAFRRETFDEGAGMLLRLAACENESWGNNATGQFKSLFPVRLSNTAADGAARLRFLREAITKADKNTEPILVEALLSGSETLYFTRTMGAESHGTLPALRSWEPSAREAWEYVEECVGLLADVATRSGGPGCSARAGLGHRLTELISGGSLDLVERTVESVVTNSGRYWPEAIEGIGSVLAHHASELDEGVEGRLREILNALQPTDLAARLRLLVTSMPWDYPCEEELDFVEKTERQRDAVYALAKEAARSRDELVRLLPGLCTGPQRMAATFGAAIAELDPQPLTWLEPIKAASVTGPPEKRNFDLLAGFVGALNSRHPEAVHDLKMEAFSCSALAPAFPLLCWRVGLAADDVEPTCKALAQGYVEPWRLRQWSFGGAIGELPAEAVAELFELLLKANSESYSVALELMTMYAHRDAEKLQDLRRELHLVAARSGEVGKTHFFGSDGHNFETLMKWLLAQGPHDPDARRTALTLAQGLVGSADSSDHALAERLVPTLLREFSNVVWPLLGDAITGNRRNAWRFEHILGHKFAFDGEKKPALLELPEDLLFGWCHAHPEVAPAFVAGVVPVLTKEVAGASERELHPIALRLLDEFGERDEVLRALLRNINTFGWSGSPTTYYALYREPLSPLVEHPIAAVRVWAKRTLEQLTLATEAAKDDDEDRSVRWEF